MATTLQELLVKINADVSGLTDGLSGAIAALDKAGESAKRTGNVISKAFESLGVGDSFAKVASQMKNLQSSFGLIEKAYQEGKVSAADYAKAQEGLRTQMERLSGIAKPLAMEFDKLGEAFKAIGASKTQFQIGSQITELKKNLDYLDAAYKAGKISAADFAKAQESVRVEIDKLTKVPVQTFADQLANLGKAGDSLRNVGSLLTASLTVPIVGVGAASFKMAADFELAMRKVTSLMGDGADSAFKPLSDGVLELSKRLGVDAVGAAHALYEAISAGIPQGNALEFLEVASKAAIAGVTSTKVAVDGMTSVINAYGLEASKAKELSDAMFQSVNIGKFTFEQLAASIGIAAGTASQLGVNYKELMAAAATITKQGFSVSEAFTMIQSSLTALIKPHKQMIDLMKQTGYESGQALISAKGYEGALNALAKSADGDMTTIATAFGRIEGTKALLALTGKNAKMAAEDFDSLKNSAGAAGKAFDEIDKSFTRQLERFTTGLKDTGIELGTALLPLGQSLLTSLKPVAAAIGDLVSAFTKLPVPAQEAGIAIAAITAGIGPLVYILGQLASAVPNIAAAVKVFQELAASAAVMEALGTALAVATPLAIAFSVAVAGWVVYKAITEIGELDNKLTQLWANLAAGKQATKSQGDEIEALITVLKKAGKEIPSTFDFSGNLKSVADYTTELKTAVGKLDDFKGKALGASDALKGGTINIGAAADAYLGLGSASDSAGSKITSNSKAIAAMNAELKAARTALREAQEAFKLGGPQADVAAATERVRAAMKALNPELNLNAHAYGAMAKEAKAAAKEISESFKVLGIEGSSLQIAESAAKLNKAYAEQISLFQEGKITSTDLAKAYEALQGKLNALNGIHPNWLKEYEAGMDNAIRDSEILGHKVEALEAKFAGKLQLPVWDVQPQMKQLSDIELSALDMRDKVSAAFKDAGLASDEFADKASRLRQDWLTVQAAVASNAATQTQADELHARYVEADVKQLHQIADIKIREAQAELARQVASGTAITETQKRTMDELVRITREGHRTLKTQWDLLANHIGDSFQIALDNLAEDLLTGKGFKNIKDIFSALWNDIAKSFVHDLIDPVTKEIGKFISGSLKDMMGDASAQIKGVFKKTVAGGASVFSGDTSEASYNPGSGSDSSGASSGSGAGGLAGAMPYVQAGIAAAAGITQGLQMAHLISTAGKIEVNTREMSTVMWQNGAESLQGIGKRSLNELIYLGDRLNEIRDSLFDPVTVTLEGIWQSIKTGGFGSGGSGDGTPANRQPGVGEPDFGPPKYVGYVGAAAGGATAKESLSELTRQLAEANAQLEKIKADRKVYASEFNSMSTNVDRRKDLAVIDAANSDKQQGLEGTIKALQYTLDQLTKAVGHGTAEVTQGITSLNSGIQSSILTQGSAAANTAAAIEAVSEAVQANTAAFVEGNTGSGSAYSLDLRATDRWGRIIDSFGNTLSSVGQSISNLGDVAANALGSFSDAVQNTAQTIASSVASLVPAADKATDAPALGSQIASKALADMLNAPTVPSTNSESFGNPTPSAISPNMLGGRVGTSQLDNTGSAVHVHVNIDGQQVTSAIVNSLELQGVRF